MKINFPSIIALTAIILFTSWTVRLSQSIKNVEWLKGTWVNKSAKGNLFETWKQVNKNELSGKSYVVKSKDTMIFETVRLIHQHDSLFYIPTVANQNSNQPIRFTAIEITDKKMLFENRAHDFPQRISYTRIGVDSLVAVVSGEKKGKSKKEVFGMKRVK